MGFLSGILGTSNQYQYNPQGINNPGQVGNAANQNFAGTIGQQQALVNALQSQSQGQGPNPAQQMLQQATQNNNAQNAGFLASQKGIDPAIANRLAAQNAASGNQQAAGQGALLGAQQQLAAQQQQGGVLGQLANENLTQAGQQYGMIGAQNSINSGVAAGNQQTNAAVTGGILGGAGSAAAAMAANGGQVQKMADGGGIISDTPSILSGYLSGMPKTSLDNSGAQSMQKGMNSFGNGMGKAMKSPDQSQAITNNGMINSSQIMQDNQNIIPTQMAANGGDVGSKLKSGGGVPGTPKVVGNSYSNDTVKALLSPGEVVIPNNIMQSGDPAGNAAKFVQAVLAKKRAKNG